MKATHTEVLKRQIEIGQDLLNRLQDVGDEPTLDMIQGDYDRWDSLNIEILQMGFVAQQYFRMYSGTHPAVLGTPHSTPFMNKRAILNSLLPKKIGHLKSALYNTQNSFGNLDLAPIPPEIVSKILNAKTQIIPMKKIFISHSSEDKLIVTPLINLLLILGLKHEQIFYTSKVGYGIPIGSKLYDHLKEILNGEIFAFLMLSENYFNSTPCLCELGAVWIKSIKQAPILIPPFDYDKMEAVIEGVKGIKINDRSGLNSLKDEIQAYFGLSQIPTNIWDTNRDEFLDKVNALLPKTV